MLYRPFRRSAGLGKRIEYYVVSLMLKEGLDVFLPMVIDDDGIDVLVKRPDKKYAEIQIKTRPKDVRFGHAALFAHIEHEYRNNHWFVFYSERIDTILIMSSKEFLKEAVQNKTGKNIGKRSIWFNGKNTKENKEHIKPQFIKYVAKDFRRILNDDPNKS